MTLSLTHSLTALCSYPLKLGSPKFLKVKAQFSLNFVPNLKFQFWLVKNSTKFEGKIFLLNICQKCVIWRQKTCCWCQGNLKFCTDANYVVLKKTPQNNFFLWAEQHGQNGIWNLEIFVEFFHRQKYLVCLSEACVQLVPTILSILPAECLNYNWFIGNFYCCSRLWSTRTQI